MKNEELESLVLLYATWDTDTLADALTHRPEQFAPEALDLIAKELKKRDVSSDSVASPATPAIHQFIESNRRKKEEDRLASPAVQYVGAWGLSFLLNFGAMFLLSLAFRGHRLRGPVAAILPAALLLGISFATFYLAVKWMVVDDLTKKFRKFLREKYTQP